MANPWTSFYWDTYNRDTEELTVTEHGAYFLLLKHYYCTGGPISANADRLLLVCRASADSERAAVMFVLSRYFLKEGDFYRHMKCDQEIAKAVQLSEKRRDAGKKGAEKTNSAKAPAKKRQLPTHLQLQEERFVFPKELLLFKEDWDQFEIMRKRIRKDMTDQARKNICAKLLKIKQASGDDPGLVLQQSITNSWQDVYELRRMKGILKTSLPMKNAGDEFRRQLESD